MEKAQIFSSHAEMEKARIADDMAMTPEQRLHCFFDLIELTQAFNQNKRTTPPSDDFPWIELKMRDE